MKRTYEIMKMPGIKEIDEILKCSYLSLKNFPVLTSVKTLWVISDDDQQSEVDDIDLSVIFPRLQNLVIEHMPWPRDYFHGNDESFLLRQISMMPDLVYCRLTDCYGQIVPFKAKKSPTDFHLSLKVSPFWNTNADPVYEVPDETKKYLCEISLSDPVRFPGYVSDRDERTLNIDFLKDCTNLKQVKFDCGFVGTQPLSLKNIECLPTGCKVILKYSIEEVDKDKEVFLARLATGWTITRYKTKTSKHFNGFKQYIIYHKP